MIALEQVSLMGIGEKIRQSHLRFSLIDMDLILQQILAQCKFVVRCEIQIWSRFKSTIPVFSEFQARYPCYCVNSFIYTFLIATKHTDLSNLSECSFFLSS